MPITLVKRVKIRIINSEIRNGKLPVEKPNKPNDQLEVKIQTKTKTVKVLR